MKLTREEFIKKARLVHGDRYDYYKVVYRNARTNVTITCPIHGDFEQTPNKHINSCQGCPECGKERARLGRISNTERFIKNARLVHKDNYGYSKTEYVNANTKVIITCPTHEDFKQTPTSHLSGQGCPRCINKTEGLLFSILNESLTHYTILDQAVVCDDGKLRIDFHIAELNLYIELDGDQHFRQISSWDPPEKTQAHDLTKTMHVLKEGQSLVRIYQPWVASDTNNWLEKLKENIREYENPTAVFIGPEGTYDKHKEDLHFSKLSNKLYETKMVY
jgi:very-short-patch-repair endonuclease